MPADSDTLQYVGDVSGPLVLTAQSPSGPDGSARWTISGDYAGVTLVFEKTATLTTYTADSWTPLATVVRQDTFNVLANGEAAGLTDQTMDFVAPSLYGLYAVRVRLAAISSGSILVQAVTTARPLTDPSSFMARMALELTRIRFAVSVATGLQLDEIDGSNSLES